jgi:RecB family exonuclease
MTYLDRPAPSKGAPWAHNSFGASVHNALAGWWRLAREDRTVPAVGKLLERGWIIEGYADSAQSARQLSRARLMVDRYVGTLDPDNEPAGVERTVATKTELIAFSGRIDRLDDRPADPARPGEARQALQPGIRGADRDLVVVDYKTGRMPLSDEDARSSFTLALYALAASRVLRRPCTTVELHHLPTGKVARWEHTPQALDRQLRRAEDIAMECSAADERFRAGDVGAEALDAVFPPTPSGGCGWCDFRAHCPEGQLASQVRQPWDGLADEDGS